MRLPDRKWLEVPVNKRVSVLCGLIQIDSTTRKFAATMLHAAAPGSLLREFKYFASSARGLRVDQFERRIRTGWCRVQLLKAGIRRQPRLARSGAGEENFC
jgi:hypothetical protein